MELNFEDKKVMVAGAGKGFGFEIAKAFAMEGAFVAICARNSDDLIRSKKSLYPQDEKVFTYPMDATLSEDVSRTLKKVSVEMGGLDILINNVGSTEKFADFFDLDEMDWINTYQLNVMSIVHCVKSAYPLLRKSPSPRIVNIASVTGLQPGIFSPHYSSSKAAVINLSKHLSNRFAEEKILVNCIVPGPFESVGWDRNIERIAHENKLSLKNAQMREIQTASGNIPLKRIGTPKDLVPMILLLSSQHSSWISGSVMVLDGGKMRGIH